MLPPSHEMLKVIRRGVSWETYFVNEILDCDVTRRLNHPSLKEVVKAVQNTTWLSVNHDVLGPLRTVIVFKMGLVASTIRIENNTALNYHIISY